MPVPPTSIRIEIPRPPARYDVTIGRGTLALVGPIAAAIAPHDRALVVNDAALASTHARAVLDSLRAAGYTHAESCSITADEAAKSLDTVTIVYQRMAAARLDRRSPVIAVGGGLVGDLAGFAAATFLRGLPFINVPTTLLAMVDAAVGGKTGVNLALPTLDSPAKNLIGAFHQPSAVIIDLTTLATLPQRQLRAALAECLKHGLVADADLFDWTARNGAVLLARPDIEVIDFISRNIRVKGAIVQSDERESAGRRLLLNLGHTFAHAIETRPELGLVHGEAVGIGLIAVAAAGRAMGKTAPDLPDRIASALSALGLPTTVNNLPHATILLAAMHVDKKVSRGVIRLVVPVRIGHAEVADCTDPAILITAWDHVRP